MKGFIDEDLLDEDLCRALLTKVRYNLVIALYICRFTKAGERVLLDGIRRNMGPSELQICYIDARLLADSLLVRAQTGLRLVRLVAVHSISSRSPYSIETFTIIL